MSVGAVNKTTGDRIPTAGMPAIDDALDLTSVNPVQNAIITAALANKQDKTDNSLQTTDKTVVGAVNELKSGLTKLSELRIYKKWANSITIHAGMNTIVMFAGMSGKSNMFTYNSYSKVLTPIGDSSGITATADTSTETVTFSANTGGSFAVYVL